ncbi:MAG: hypothetical protein QOF89_1811 [Acidobacteriota bacterium]|jgi:hypothetical protein|nr:hypothetical protein [Acidobacteriota bacterium]
MASFTSLRRLAAAASLLAAISLPAFAQPPEARPLPEATPPPDEPAATPAATPQTTPAPLPAPIAPQPPAPTQPAPPGAGPAEAGPELPPKPADDRILPRLDVFFPEGDLDLRIGRLINEVFFEGQVKYNFINGDITAFLRYRYYSLRRTTQLTVFDSIQFDNIDQNVTDDFDRTRGTLLLLQWPHSYSHRTAFLAELDRISTNKSTEASRLQRLGSSNTFIRYSYQFGTPEDGRSNAIVGEPRARTERLFSAFREIGPGGAGFTAALTYGFPYGIGSYDYVKLEIEALKRFDVTQRSFLIGRLSGGSFPYAKDVAPDPTLPPSSNPEIDRLRIPRGDFFRLDGRDGLLGLKTRRRGTEVLFMTWEYFMPWFIERPHRFMWLDWQNWYWILYTGAGTIGFDRKVYSDFSTYVPDAGLGFESSFKLRKYRFFLSGIVAQALKGSGGVEARISVKSYR